MYPIRNSESTARLDSPFSDQEAESFLHGEKVDNLQSSNSTTKINIPIFWIASNFIFASLLAISVIQGWKIGGNDTYETGFRTELQPAREAIALQERKFWGGIIVNETADWELILDPKQPRYVGHPTKELDAAWDMLVGNYVALSEAEASTVHGQHSKENGYYFVVPHVRHTLHCVNYLRKALYPKYYPTLRHESRERVPDYYTHVDHCLETIRETVQCNQDMTPVPHYWSEEKGMFLANTMLTHTCRDFVKLLEWQDERDRTRPQKEAHPIDR